MQPWACLDLPCHGNIHNKSVTIAQYQANLVLLSETSATSRVQALETFNLKRKGLFSLWGAPAPPQMRDGLDTSLRGAATGVSMHSTFPMRSCANQVDDTWETLGRFQRGFVHVPNLALQICNLYGYPSATPSAKPKTNQLLQYAYEQSCLTTYPTILAGDFNHDPTTLDAYHAMRAHGYLSIQDLYHQRTGQRLPPTFKQATCNDSAILSPALLPLVGDIWVDDQQLLAGHNPLCFELHIPGQPLHKQTWKLPKSWISLAPEKHLVERYYEESPWQARSSADEGLHPLQTWAVQVEQAVHKALQHQHAEDPVRHPVDGLPRAYRGRCQPRKLVNTPYTTPIKTACAGQYQPCTRDQ